MHKKTIRDIEVDGKTVLVRVDYNVPLTADGGVGDIYRIKAGLPTLNYLLERGCKLILMSHLGRPEGKPDPKFSLAPVAKELANLIERPIQFAPECIGETPKRMAQLLQPGQILLLENLRFHPEEEADDPEFAHQLADLGEVFVQDGFGNAHRKHASMDAITQFLPSVAGLLLEKEVTSISSALEQPKRPLLAIVGGAKVSDKIELIQNLVKKADHVVIAGAMANTFFLNQHFKHPIGKSVHEEGLEAEVDKIVQAVEGKGKTPAEFLVLPDEDVAVAKAVDKAAARQEIATKEVKDDDFIIDFGARSTHKVTRLVHQAGTVIWNGTLGVTEIPQFATSSLEVARAIANAGVTSIVAGGDTAGFIDQAKMVHLFSHVSTGGGAALELMAGKPLPGVESLLDK